MKGLLWGIFFIILVGFGGFFYRNAVEHPSQPIACPLDAEMCPDGTMVTRTGLSCTFPTCPAPNVTLTNIGLSFAIPVGFKESSITEPSSVAAYALDTASSTATSTNFTRIVLHQYAIDASSTPLEVIQRTAINGSSGLPASITSFSSSVIEGRRFSVVTVERFEGVIDTAYYLARQNDVIRFDAIDANVQNWTDANLDIHTLPAHAALVKMLATLQVL